MKILSAAWSPELQGFEIAFLSSDKKVGAAQVQFEPETNRLHGGYGLWFPVLGDCEDSLSDEDREALEGWMESSPFLALAGKELDEAAGEFRGPYGEFPEGFSPSQWDWERTWMNPHTGSVDTYNGWFYEGEDGETKNGVEEGGLIEVRPTTTPQEKEEWGDWIEEDSPDSP